MPALAACQLILDPPADGAWNMAVDEVLLGHVAKSGQPVLRFYQWQRPTLSLGYFQKASDRSAHPSSLDADLVRRLSGGGAIVHDQELTYSLFLPQTHNLSHDPQSLYNTVHQTIAKILNTFLDTSLSDWQAVLCDRLTNHHTKDEPFLCFERRAIGDILLRKKEFFPQALTHKIVGSAQRRRQGVVLQHGSILLSQSRMAPELAGFTEVAHVTFLPTDLLAHLPEALAQALSLSFKNGLLTKDLARLATEKQGKKYQASNWTKRR